jgi:phosphoribosylamine--glycine ligase
MRILVLGSGGREHAILQSLSTTSARPLELFCAPGNGGIAQLAECVPVKATDVDGLVRFAVDRGIDLTIVGSEAPLAAGLVDAFQTNTLLVAGPNKNAARLESSKVFAKEFMQRHGIPTARYRSARSTDEALAILRSGEFGGAHEQVVIKADGLAAGKGVVVAASRAEAEKAVLALMIEGVAGKDAAKSIVIEEVLSGPEASLLLFSDGSTYALMPAARDHKRIGENDTGPNTGGMGAITTPNILDEVTLARAVREIVEPTLEGARSDRLEFRGVLFIGLMLTAEGPKVLEYNVRFGDPETQAILMRLKTDLAQVFEAVARGTLDELRLDWSTDSSACVVLAAEGYPGNPRIGDRISGLEQAAALQDVKIFHSGTIQSDDGAWRTAGGRVLGVTSSAPTLDAALRNCYSAIDEISWEGMQFRRDIGKFR